jgi:uncharacterized protein (TIGR02444 family)
MALEAPADPAAAEAFWRFSLDFYARANVAAALTALQDREGRDVNLMLFALWLGLSGRPRLAPCGIAAAEHRIATIRTEIAEPLRRVRRRLRGEPDADVQELRRRIAALEIDAERAGQFRLAALAGTAAELSLPHRLAAAGANLAMYLGPAGAGSREAEILRQALAEFIQDGEGS